MGPAPVGGPSGCPVSVLQPFGRIRDLVEQDLVGRLGGTVGPPGPPHGAGHSPHPKAVGFVPRQRRPPPQGNEAPVRPLLGEGVREGGHPVPAPASWGESRPISHEEVAHPPVAEGVPAPDLGQVQVRPRPRQEAEGHHEPLGDLPAVRVRRHGGGGGRLRGVVAQVLPPAPRGGQHEGPAPPSPPPVSTSSSSSSSSTGPPGVRSPLEQRPQGRLHRGVPSRRSGGGIVQPRLPQRLAGPGGVDVGQDGEEAVEGAGASGGRRDRIMGLPPRPVSDPVPGCRPRREHQLDGRVVLVVIVAANGHGSRRRKLGCPHPPRPPLPPPPAAAILRPPPLEPVRRGLVLVAAAPQQVDGASRGRAVTVP